MKSRIFRVKRALLVFTIILLFVNAYILFLIKTTENISHKTAIAQLVTNILDVSIKKKINGSIKIEYKIETPEKDIGIAKDIKTIFMTEFSRQNMEQTKNRPAFRIFVPYEEFGNEVRRIKDKLQNKYRMRPQKINKILKSMIKWYPKSDIVSDNKMDISLSADANNKRNLKLEVQIQHKAEKIGPFFVEFTSPVYESQYKHRIKSFYITGAIFSFFLILFIMLTAFIFFKRRKYFKYFDLFEGKFRGYFNEGSYIAANQLINQIIEYLPENTDIKAYQERLYDFCGGASIDALKKAQIAYVEAQKLKLINKRITESGSFSTLRQIAQDVDTARLKNLISYNPELKTEYHNYISSLDTIKKEEEYLKKVNACKALKNKGFISEAINEVENIIDSFPDKPELIDFLEELNKRKRNVSQKYEKAREKIRCGAIAAGEKLLDECISINKNFQDAYEQKRILNQARNINSILLIPENIGKKLYIFKKKNIVFGRKETETPDVNIDNKKISRDKHFKVSIAGDKVVCEDMKSSNGTFYRGKRIDRVEILDGDIITLARTYKIIFHIKRNISEAIQMTIVDTPRNNYIKTPVSSLGAKNIMALFLETADANVIILIDCMDINFKSIGIIYDKVSNYKVCLKNGIICLQKDDEQCEILLPGNTIDESGVQYKILKLE